MPFRAAAVRSCEKITKRAAERRLEVSPGPAKRSPGLEVNRIKSPEGATEDLRYMHSCRPCQGSMTPLPSARGSLRSPRANPSRPLSGPTLIFSQLLKGAGCDRRILQGQRLENHPLARARGSVNYSRLGEGSCSSVAVPDSSGSNGSSCAPFSVQMAYLDPLPAYMDTPACSPLMLRM